MKDFKKHFGFELVPGDLVEVRYEDHQPVVNKGRIMRKAKGTYINCDEDQFNFYLTEGLGNWCYRRSYLGSSAHTWIEKLT